VSARTPEPPESDVAQAVAAAEPAAVAEGTTARLIQLCLGYYTSYVATGILVKWYTGGLRTPRLSDMAFLYNNTLGSTLLCVIAVLALGWLRLPSKRTRRWFGITFPEETPFIVASGVCTAVVIPATTLLYTLPVSVMVAMVIMRGSVIVISRAVDAVLARQGLLRRPVRAEENWAVVFALLAVATNVLLAPLVRVVRGLLPAEFVTAHVGGVKGGFEFLRSPLAVSVLGAYIVAYSIRLYWMNYFKLTRRGGGGLDNRGYFAIEQLTATTTMLVVTAGLVVATRALGWQDPRLVGLSQAAAHPDISAMLSGIPYGLIAFFSVFLFMFQGRTATFAGLVNRITSLLAGTTATLLLMMWFHLPPPGVSDWVSLVFVGVAVGLLARVEATRARVGPGPSATTAAAPAVGAGGART
jgi:hypothetical protein